MHLFPQTGSCYISLTRSFGTFSFWNENGITFSFVLTFTIWWTLKIVKNFPNYIELNFQCKLYSFKLVSLVKKSYKHINYTRINNNIN